MIPIGFGLIHLISTHFQMIIKLLKKKKWDLSWCTCSKTVWRISEISHARGVFDYQMHTKWKVYEWYRTFLVWTSHILSIVFPFCLSAISGEFPTLWMRNIWPFSSKLSDLWC
jgi:hypothetical protein